jgi:hypothetical protein
MCWRSLFELHFDDSEQTIHLFISHELIGLISIVVLFKKEKTEGKSLAYLITEIQGAQGGGVLANMNLSWKVHQK